MIASWLGWAAVIFIATSAMFPLGYRALQKRRAAPNSPPIRAHVVLGAATTIVVFLHTLAALPELGASAVVEGGSWALLPAGVAFCAVIAHAGIGLQLRDPMLRKRAPKRRTHVITAVAIALAVIAHVWMLGPSD